MKRLRMARVRLIAAAFLIARWKNPAEDVTVKEKMVESMCGGLSQELLS
jgi:hypothetical protein